MSVTSIFEEDLFASTPSLPPAFPQGSLARCAAERERRAELEQRAVELLADEVLESIRVWIEVRDDLEALRSARLAAADRIIERILGRVDEKLLVQSQERREVTVRNDVERLAEIVGGLKQVGGINGEAKPLD